MSSSEPTPRPSNWRREFSIVLGVLSLILVIGLPAGLSMRSAVLAAIVWIGALGWGIRQWERERSLSDMSEPVPTCRPINQLLGLVVVVLTALLALALGVLTFAPEFGLLTAMILSLIILPLVPLLAFLSTGNWPLLFLYGGVVLSRWVFYRGLRAGQEGVVGSLNFSWWGQSLLPGVGKRGAGVAAVVGVGLALVGFGFLGPVLAHEASSTASAQSRTWEQQNEAEVAAYDLQQQQRLQSAPSLASEMEYYFQQQQQQREQQREQQQQQQIDSIQNRLDRAGIPGDPSNPGPWGVHMPTQHQIGYSPLANGNGQQQSGFSSLGNRNGQQQSGFSMYSGYGGGSSRTH